jgi:catechol-2,3-dioxygenase
MNTNQTDMLQELIIGIKETCLYVENLEASYDFYKNVLGLNPISFA